MNNKLKSISILLFGISLALFFAFSSPSCTKAQADDGGAGVEPMTSGSFNMQTQVNAGTLTFLFDKKIETAGLLTVQIRSDTVSNGVTPRFTRVLQGTNIRNPSELHWVTLSTVLDTIVGVGENAIIAVAVDTFAGYRVQITQPSGTQTNRYTVGYKVAATQ